GRDPPREAQGLGQVRGTFQYQIDPGYGQDFGDVLDTGLALDHGYDHDFAIGLHRVVGQAVFAERAGTAAVQAPRSLGMVFAGGDDAAHFVGVFHPRHHDALGATVEFSE